MIRGWIEADIPHGSAIMLPDGQMFGRILSANGELNPLALINVVGDDLHFWYPDMGTLELPSFVASHAQAFDDGTIERLRRLSIAVIGCSGTGSPTIEQLFRLVPANSSPLTMTAWKSAMLTASPIPQCRTYSTTGRRSTYWRTPLSGRGLVPA
jgi:hypothetical protein